MDIRKSITAEGIITTYGVFLRLSRMAKNVRAATAIAIGKMVRAFALWGRILNRPMVNSLLFY